MIIETKEQLRGVLENLRSQKIRWTGAVLATDKRGENSRVLLLSREHEVVESMSLNFSARDFIDLYKTVTTRWSWMEVQARNAFPLKNQTLDERNLLNLTLAKLKSLLSDPARPKKKGRTGHITAKTAERVFWDSHLRCMFEGCGVPLDRSNLTGHAAYFGYLAHIVPASENGPRGEQAGKGECEELVDVAENLMLLCDKCHRLIDRVAVAEYPRQRLEKMRQGFIQKANRCLDALQFAESSCASFLWPIGGRFVKGPAAEEISQCLLPLQLRWSGRIDPLSETLFTSLDNKTLEYWSGAPASLNAAAARLQSLNHDHRLAPMVLAAMGPMPALIALGALIGSKSDMQPLLCSREDGWSWRSDESASPCWTIEGLEEEFEHAEVVVSICLTAHPEGQKKKEQEIQEELGCPIVLVKADEFSNHSVGLPAEARMLQNQVWELLNRLRSENGVVKVHLLVCASNLACLAIGMSVEQYAPEIQIYDFLNDEAGGVSLQPTLNLLPENDGVKVKLSPATQYDGIS